MMMPANFSAIAESEMTYVVGGASLVEALGAVTAPIWNADNVKKFNTNLVTLIGNSYVSTVVSSTLGVMFGGNWGKKVHDEKTPENFIFGKKGAIWKNLDPNPNGTTNGLNKFMQGLGFVAGVYTLGTGEVKNAVSQKAFDVDFNVVV